MRIDNRITEELKPQEQEEQEQETMIITIRRKIITQRASKK